MSEKIILVGCGNMGFAMLEGWIQAGRLLPPEIVVVEPTETLRARAAALGVAAVAAPTQLREDLKPLIVLMAVKPQVMRDVLPAYRRHSDAGATVVSVAAGIGVPVFEEILGPSAAVIRCMPNTPAAIGKGMMVTFANRNAKPEARQYVAELLAASGAVAEIDDEALMDAVTAVSGSGPAYVFHFIEALSAAAEAAGLPSETAKLLAMQTVYGAASLARESSEAPGRLRERVTSPNGTTAAALSVLMGDDRLTRLLTDAVEAARQRGIELGKA